MVYPNLWVLTDHASTHKRNRKTAPPKCSSGVSPSTDATRTCLVGQFIVYIYIYVYMCVFYAYINMHMHIHNTYTCISIHILHAHKYKCKSAYLCTYTHICVFLCDVYIHI